MQALIIMMSQNRQAEKDRIMEKKDYKVNKKAKQDIEEIQKAGLSDYSNWRSNGDGSGDGENLN